MSKHAERHRVLAKLVNADELERQNSLIRAIHEASPEGILVVDDNGIIVSHNRRFIEIWQIPEERLCGVETGTAIGIKDAPILSTVLERVKYGPAFLARVRELYDNPGLVDYCEIALQDGRTLERHSTALRGDDGRYLGRVWFFRDITAQIQTEASLKELSRLDPLTGVANRRHFFERANQEFTRTQRYLAPLSIAELDIDYFKQINDQHGHAVGDEVLKSLCKSNQDLFRESDIFARIGGEEFAILFPDTNLNEAAYLAERLRQAIAGSKVELRGGEISCTISIGVATMRLADTRIDDCLLRADSAMYRAKQNGRNRVEIES